jgi:hypothetical protein
MGGYTSKCEKKSKSLHPTVRSVQNSRYCTIPARVLKKFPSQLKKQVKGPVAVQRVKRRRLSLQILLLYPDYIYSLILYP